VDGARQRRVQRAVGTLLDLTGPAAFTPAGLLFAAQRRAFSDRSRWKAYICSRQAGKSTLDAIELLSNAVVDNPGTDAVFVAPTLGQAKKIIWRDLLELNKAHGLRGRANGTDYIIAFPNGSTVQLRGVQDRSDIEWFRGQRLSLVIIDEAQSIGAHLRELIWDVLRPTLMRHRGRVVLTGTVGLVAAGFWHDVVTGRVPGWSPHTWYLPDNPHIPDAAAEMADFATQLGGEMSPAEVEQHGGLREAGEHHPKYVREILCRWVRDDSVLVYKIDRDRNTFAALPDGEPSGCVVAGDLGTRDFSAVVTIQWWDADPAFYVTDEHIVKTNDGRTAVDLEDVRLAIDERIERYSPDRVVLDEGGLGLMVAETLRRRYAMPVEPAQKMAAGGVTGQMDMLNTDIARGRLRCGAESRFLDAAAALQWDPAAAKKGMRKLLGHEPDVAAALRYGWFLAQQIHTRPPGPQLSPDDARRAKLIAELDARAARIADWQGGMSEDLAALTGN